MATDSSSKLSTAAGVSTGLLFLVSLMNAFDRQIALVVAEPLRLEWGLSDAQVGLLAGAFTLVYAVTGVPMGILVDRVPRFRFLAIGTLAWTAFTALGGVVRSYGQLLGSRLAVGLAESTFFPASMSLLGDLHPPHRRNRAIGVVLLGIPIGVALSFGVGGAVAAAHGWRAAFYLAIVPGLLSTVASLAVREPARGASEEHAIGRRGRGPSAFGVLMKIPTFWIIVAAGALHMFASFAQAAFLTPFLMRYHQMKVDEAGKTMALVAGLAPCIGMLLAGAYADRMRKQRSDAPMLVGLWCFALAIPCLLVALQCHRDQRGLLIVSLGLSQVLCFPFISFQQTVIQEIVEPRFRGTAVALQSLAASIIGAAGGPLATGFLSDAIATRLAGGEPLETFRPEGIRLALYLVPAVLFVLCVVLAFGLRAARRDANALTQWIAAEGTERAQS